MSERPVVVIGGGVIGVCSAYYLAEAGRPVVLVDQAEVCAGSSHGNSGLVVPSHCIPLAAPGVWLRGLRGMLNAESPLYIRPRPSAELAAWLWRFRSACTPDHVRRAMPVLRDLSQASLELYRELAALPGLDFGFAAEGAMGVYVTEAEYAHGVEEARTLGEAGITTKVLDGPGARAVEPALRPEVLGGILFPEDARLIPDRFVRGLAARAEGRGVRIQPKTEVLGFRTAGRRILAVETTRGDVEPSDVVLAAGAWSPRLGRTMGLALAVQPGKGYSVTYARPPAGPRLPLLLGEVRVAVTPMGDTLRFGGTMELAGLDLSVNRRRVAAIVRGAARYLHDVDRFRVQEIWRGLRPVTPDGLPLLGRSSRVENLVVATGHAMVGMSLGPITGKLVARLCAGEPPAIDLSLLRPERFG